MVLLRTGSVFHSIYVELLKKVSYLDSMQVSSKERGYFSRFPSDISIQLLDSAFQSSEADFKLQSFTGKGIKENILFIAPKFLFSRAMCIMIASLFLAVGTYDEFQTFMKLRVSHSKKKIRNPTKEQ